MQRVISPLRLSANWNSSKQPVSLVLIRKLDTAWHTSACKAPPPMCNAYKNLKWLNGWNVLFFISWLCEFWISPFTFRQESKYVFPEMLSWSHYLWSYQALHLDSNLTHVPTGFIYGFGFLFSSCWCCRPSKMCYTNNCRRRTVNLNINSFTCRRCKHMFKTRKLPHHSSILLCFIHISVQTDVIVKLTFDLFSLKLRAKSRLKCILLPSTQ